MDRTSIINELFESMGALRKTFVPHGNEMKGMPTRSQLFVMMVIAQQGPQSTKDMAEKLCMTPSAVTQLVDTLVEDKLIVRKDDKDDRRKSILTLTHDGIKRLDEAKKHRMVSMVKLLSPLTDKELIQLRDLQRKILTHIAP